MNGATTPSESLFSVSSTSTTPGTPTSTASPSPSLSQSPSSTTTPSLLSSKIKHELDNGIDDPSVACSICLDCPVTHPCMLDQCFHVFCYECALEWATVTPTCPLCKKHFDSVIHNVRSVHSYDRRWLVRQQRQSSRTVSAAGRSLGYPEDAHRYNARFGQLDASRCASSSRARETVRKARVLAEHWAPAPRPWSRLSRPRWDRVVSGFLNVSRPPPSTAAVRSHVDTGHIAYRWLRRDVAFLLQAREPSGGGGGVGGGNTAPPAEDDDLVELSVRLASSAARSLVQGGRAHPDYAIETALEPLAQVVGARRAAWLLHELACFLASHLSMDTYDDMCHPDARQLSDRETQEDQEANRSPTPSSAVPVPAPAPTPAGSSSPPVSEENGLEEDDSRPFDFTAFTHEPPFPTALELLAEFCSQTDAPHQPPQKRKKTGNSQ